MSGETDEKMNKAIAEKLIILAKEVAKNYSKTDRQYNYNNETFVFEKFKPLSEKTAVIYFNKSSGKKAIAFAYYINLYGGQWKYFFLAESHIYGMLKLRDVLQEVEEFNIDKND